MNGGSAGEWGALTLQGALSAGVRACGTSGVVPRTAGGFRHRYRGISAEAPVLAGCCGVPAWGMTVCVR